MRYTFRVDITVEADDAKIAYNQIAYTLGLGMEEQICAWESNTFWSGDGVEHDTASLFEEKP